MRTTVHTLFLICVIVTQCATTEPDGCWPHNVIPFRIYPGFNDDQLYLIHDVIGDFHRSTCLRWVDNDKVPYNATDRVVFQRVEQKLYCQATKLLLSSGGVVTLIRLGDSCLEKRVLMHVMLHVLGFTHEHQRADRNCYVYINQYDAHVSGLKSQFSIQRQAPWLERFPYDKYSNTHYPRSTTMKGLDGRKYTEEPLGSQDGTLSLFDSWKILYKFCSFPHYCDWFPEVCDLIESLEKNCTEGI